MATTARVPVEVYLRSSYYRYQERQLLRNDSFSYVPKGISFPMDRIKEYLD